MDEEDALRALRDASAGIVTGVGEALPRWVEHRSRVIVEAWGRHVPHEAEEIVAAAAQAGAEATARIGRDLERLFAADPDAQGATPMQIIRSVHVEVTPVLASSGIPPLQRDEFAERAIPEDEYGLAPDTLADLGGEALNDAHLAWGAAKAAVHLSRRP